MQYKPIYFLTILHYRRQQYIVLATESKLQALSAGPRVIQH